MGGGRGGETHHIREGSGASRPLFASPAVFDSSAARARAATPILRSVARAKRHRSHSRFRIVSMTRCGEMWSR